MESELVDFLRKYDYPVPQFLRQGIANKILIVEDDMSQRRLMVRLIQNNFSKFQIFEAENGFEAGFMARDLRPALVILDLLLPDIHGARICRLIRQSKELKNIKILSITACKIEKSKRVLLKAGANTFLAKPYQNEEFVEAVSHLLGLKPQRPSLMDAAQQK